MKLVDHIDDPSIFVALDRQRRCYPELRDTSWTGRRKARKRKVKCSAADTVSQQIRTGPVTRAMAYRLQENDQELKD